MRSDPGMRIGVSIDLAVDFDFFLSFRGDSGGKGAVKGSRYGILQ
jgi:hypothetical protein